MLAIYKKELRAYFNSIIGWLFLAFFLAFVGMFFYVINVLSGDVFIGSALSNDVLNCSLLVLVPIVTMRIMAEEKRQKTDQLLLTSPLPIWKIVAGKYLALVTLIGIAMAVICIYPLLLAQFGIINFAMSYTSILGFFLLLCAYLAIGLFISSITESQVFAAVMTFIALLLSYLMNVVIMLIPSTEKAAWITYSVIWTLISIWIWNVIKNASVAIIVFAIGECALTVLYMTNGELLQETMSSVLGAFSLVNVFNEANGGVLTLQMPVYYLSISFIFCFLTYQGIRKRRYN